MRAQYVANAPAKNTLPETVQLIQKTTSVSTVKEIMKLETGVVKPSS